MNNERKRTIWAPSVLLLSAFSIVTIILLLNLGATTLFDMDEPTYAQIAREIVKTGDWVTLRFNGLPWFDKPPLFFWLVGASFKLFGFNEFAVRLPSVLAALGTLIITYLLGCAYFGNQRQGIKTMLITAGCLQFYVIARLAVVDMLLTFFITLALYSFVLWRQGKQNAILLSYAAMALATMTKGPVGAIIPAAIIVIYLCLQRRPGDILQMKILPGLLVYFLLAAPWYLAEYNLYGKVFIDEFFGYRTFTRYLQPLEQQSGPIYFYILFLLIGLFPWSLFLPGAITASIKNRRDPLPLVWAGFIFLFFTGAATKLPNYMLPLYPALALTIAGMWPESNPLDIRGQRQAYSGAIALITASALLAWGVFWLAYNKLDPAVATAQIKRTLPVLMVLPAGFAVSCLVAAVRREGTTIYKGVTLTALSFITLLGLLVFPALNATKPLPELAAEAATLLENDKPIYSYEMFNASIPYYSEHRMLRLKSVQEVSKALQHRENMLMLVKQINYDAFPAHIKADFEVAASAGNILLLKEIPK
ncbi:MAG: glycosyltransferase family 39 protein [bacterium]|jgi:4-amino-4-deoxy-L-arabinose transferase-like glycosyltransferase|nr:glycosyltransferase family 39 protein [bacterium]